MPRNTVSRLLRTLEPPFRRKAFALQGFLVLGVLFESVGLGLVVPLVSVITDPLAAERSGSVRTLKRITGDITVSQLTLLVLGCFVFFYIVKTVFLSFMIHRQSEFTQGLSRNISTRLFRGYVFQPYSFYLDKNSGVLMKNVVAEIGAFTSYVQAVMYLQTEIAVLIGIVITLFVLEPMGALVIFSFVGGMSYLLYSLSRRNVTRWGKERQQNDAMRSKSLLQGLNGVAELKLFHAEEHFLDTYDRYNQRYYQSQQKVQYAQQVQVKHIELVLVLGIAVLSIAVILQGRSIGSILPSLSLFMFASLRLLPSSNKIIVALQSIRFAKPGLELVFTEFDQFAKEGDRGEAKAEAPVIGSSIALRDITYTYPSATRAALESVSMEMPVGSVTGIIGQSGSGKTTLVNILTGLLKPSSGSIEIDGRDLTASIRHFDGLIGYVPQQIFLIDDTLEMNIAFGIAEEKIDKVLLADVIASARLDEVVEQLPDGIRSIVGERGIKLSGGQRQRIGIARALYRRPQLLILDEGTSALDNETESYIMESVANLKGRLTILLVAHRYSTLNICDTVYKMQNGKVVQKGTLHEVTG